MMSIRYDNRVVVVTGAGNLCDKSFAKFQPEDFDAVVGVHLSGSAYCSLAAWLHMKHAGYGRIVMITSPAGLFGNFGQGTMQRQRWVCTA